MSSKTVRTYFMGYLRKKPSIKVKKKCGCCGHQWIGNRNQRCPKCGENKPAN